MEGRVGKGLITMFLCLVFLSALVFVFIENRRLSTAQPGADADLLLYEVVDPWVFTGPMADYEYDLYAMGPRGLEFVPPPELEYAEPSAFDRVTLRQLAVATDEIDPASRETKIRLCIAPRACSDENNPNAVLTNVFVGGFLSLTYELTPATKTVILQGGAATAEVQVIPDAIDAYLAVRNPNGRFFFLNRASFPTKRFFGRPVPIVSNSPIGRLYGFLGNLRPDSRYSFGEYTFFAVMVPPGADVLDQSTWISNLAQARFRFGIVR
ncbi:MAG: hypothetical protein PHN82_08135 [bacterium]|nr:hypothetical protein [bacterium]